jgi:hypothetical protein
VFQKDNNTGFGEMKDVMQSLLSAGQKMPSDQQITQAIKVIILPDLAASKIKISRVVFDTNHTELEKSGIYFIKKEGSGNNPIIKLSELCPKYGRR